MTGVSWIKLSTLMFDDEKIKVIEGLPEADSILVVWIKLLCLAGRVNNNGFIFLTERIPFRPEMIATIFNRPLQTVRLALETFQQFGMIEYDENGFMCLPNWSKYQNIKGLDELREKDRLRKKAKRALLALSADTSSESPRTLSREVDLEVDIEKKKKSQIPSAKKPPKESVYSPDFLDFWKNYPRKDQKGLAWQAWCARLKEGAKPEQLIMAARNYSQTVIGKEADVIKLPATMLGKGKGPGGADPIWQEWQEPRTNGDGRKEDSRHERAARDHGFRPYGYGTDGSDYEK